MSAAKNRLSSARRNTRRLGFQKRGLQVEALEDRKMNAVVGLGVDGAGTLIIIGDDAADSITVSKSGLSTLVQFKNTAGSTTTANVGTAVARLNIRTNGGDDVVSNNTNLEATVYGGNGNDTLYGGSINDYLFGEAGSDTLHGNGGHDLLRGGNDNDYLYGQDGDDRLFGEAGTDTLFGMNGDDFLDAGSAGEVNVNGGDNNDFNAWRTVVNGAAFNDIDQRNANNCFILGAMGEAAQHGLDVNSRITYKGDGIYHVSLFSKYNTSTGVSYTPQTISVYFDGTLNPTDPAPHFRGQEGESWTVILNRALALHQGVNLATTTGGYAGNIFGALYGRAPSTVTWSDASGTQSQFMNDPVLDYLYAVGNSRPSIVSTHNAAARDTTLFAQSHVYMVHSVQVSGYLYSSVTRTMVPQYVVTLYNPHGKDNDGVGTVAGARSSGDNNDGLITITGAEFKRSFAEITSG